MEFIYITVSKRGGVFAIFAAQRRVVLKAVRIRLLMVFIQSGYEMRGNISTHLTWCLKEISISKRGAKAKNVITFGMFGNRLHNGAIDDD